MKTYRYLDIYINVLRNGVKVTELYPVEASEIVMDSESEIKTAFSGTFYQNEKVNWYTDEIQPIIEVDGEKRTCGIYIPATVNYQNEKGIESISVEAYDRAWLVKSTAPSYVRYYSEGEKYTDIIEALLVESGISLISKVDSEYTLRTDREDWEIGTDNLTVVNELLDEINYNPLWFDKDGTAIIEPQSDTTAANITREYNADDISQMIVDRNSSEIDIYDVPNVFIVVCSNVDKRGAPLISTVVNDNPLSPLSTVRRGKRICRTYKVNNIPSQSALDDYASLLSLESMFVGETAMIETALHNYNALNEIVSVNVPGLSGIYRESGWRMTLETGGKMEHTLQRMVALV